eukprot:6042164-Amphidinium_carterae.2
MSTSTSVAVVGAGPAGVAAVVCPRGGPPGGTDGARDVPVGLAGNVAMMTLVVIGLPHCEGVAGM